MFQKFTRIKALRKQGRQAGRHSKWDTQTRGQEHCDFLNPFKLRGSELWVNMPWGVPRREWAQWADEPGVQMTDRICFKHLWLGGLAVRCFKVNYLRRRIFKSLGWFICQTTWSSSFKIRKWLRCFHRLSCTGRPSVLKEIGFETCLWLQSINMIDKPLQPRNVKRSKVHVEVCDSKRYDTTVDLNAARSPHWEAFVQSAQPFQLKLWPSVRT